MTQHRSTQRNLVVKQKQFKLNISSLPTLTHLHSPRDAGWEIEEVGVMMISKNWSGNGVRAKVISSFSIQSAPSPQFLPRFVKWRLRWRGRTQTLINWWRWVFPKTKCLPTILTASLHSSHCSEKALKASNNAGLQPAMGTFEWASNATVVIDWLIAHADDAETENSMDAQEEEGWFLRYLFECTITNNFASLNDSDLVLVLEIGISDLTANSLVCDECGRMLRHTDAAQLHAHKTGHQNFSQSTEIIKPLTGKTLTAWDFITTTVL